MDWQAFNAVAKSIVENGVLVVIAAVAIVVVVSALWWLKGIVDRKIAKDEERRDRQEARNELLTESTRTATEGIAVIAKQTEKQTEFMERMDRRLDDHGKRLDEHGGALTRILEHLFGDSDKA